MFKRKLELSWQTLLLPSSHQRLKAQQCTTPYFPDLKISKCQKLGLTFGAVAFSYFYTFPGIIGMLGNEPF